MQSYKLHPMAVAIAAACLCIASAHAQETTEVGKIIVTGEGDKLGAGQLIEEDLPKAKSTVTKAAIDKARASTNPFQLLNLAPGVNASSTDATGLFGGSLRVRGFNSDQMGFTIDGAPVNDSGNFAVYPQEYTDSENLCELFVTQGASDTEAPHVGASGGNVGLVTCAPEDQHRLRVAQSLGQLNFHRTFVRYDTGLIGNYKAFLSYSKSGVDKFKGKGKADRDHVDLKLEGKTGPVKLSAGLLYNRAYNNNFMAMSLSQLAANGRDWDYSTTAPQHATPVNGTAQTDVAPNPAYYKYAVNPFENYLATAKAEVQVASNGTVSVAPYFWYGYGTGGVEQNTLTESSSATTLGRGIADMNGDGDSLDKVLIYRGSVTRTYRPGVNLATTWLLDNQKINAGIWFERARHRQTQPATSVDNNGNIANAWLDDDSALIRHQDGTFYQGRNQLTVSTGSSYFVQDAIDLGNRMQVVPGVSYREIKRDFTNYANDGTKAYYEIHKKYSQWLPSLGFKYQFSEQWQGYATIARNFRAPSNFEYQGLVTSATIVNGVPTTAVINYAAADRVKSERSTNLDLGARYHGDSLTGSASVFYVDFANRIASGYDPVSAGTYDINVGGSKIKGLELELGTVPVGGWSTYVSLTYTKSTVNDDLRTGAATYAATSGKLFPDTPEWMLGNTIQYAVGPFTANLQTKYTGRRYTTLVNDQYVGGYTLSDLNLAYQFGNFGMMKHPMVRVNVSNLFDRNYEMLNIGSGSNIAITSTATSPTIYVGAPRFASVSFQADF